MMTYSEKLTRRLNITGSRLCVGLDPRFDLIAGDPLAFLQRVVEETALYAAAYKPNIAYFESLGSRGYVMLESLLASMPTDIPIILDAKRSDIGETQKAYAQACFGHFRADAVTLNPLMGFDTIEPFLDYPGKAVYLLAVTSNAGAAELELQKLADGRYVFEVIEAMAQRAQGRATQVGFVAGLTNVAPEILTKIGDWPLLIPGLGAQGGEVTALAGSVRRAPCVINVSRGILFAEPEKSFHEKARHWAELISSQWPIAS
jgi:orotidine-5'-phosphate decarboxylase